MVEQIMFFSGGFLVATLLALTLMPVVHGRALRIANHRLKDSVPLSVKETLAQVDGLRAEFAISTRRLELEVVRLKVRSVNQLSEIGRLRADLAKSRWRGRDFLKVESYVGADAQIEHANHFEPDSDREEFLRRTERPGSFVHLKRKLMEHEQFLNRCDAGINAVFARITALREKPNGHAPSRKTVTRGQDEFPT
jgi:hypothetical protein